MAITSRISSTTQTSSLLRLGLLQISQRSESLILWQFLQNFTSVLRSTRALDKATVWDSGCFKRCRTSRRAVLFPIPGSCETSFTACSNNFEEKSIATKVRILGRKLVQFYKLAPPKGRGSFNFPKLPKWNQLVSCCL